MDPVSQFSTAFLTSQFSSALHIRAGAQKFVALCRSDLRGAMIVMFTNDESFALSFVEAVNDQHRGLVELADLPLPGPKEKETVVRVNTNRLNPFSYWYCLDRAGVEEKKRVFQTLKETSGFKDSFEAVDQAIQKATPTRMGRPPKRCLLALFVMADAIDISYLLDNLAFSEPERNVNLNPMFDVITCKDTWSDSFEIGEREAKLLRSEWNFRIILAGNQFVSMLLSGQHPLLAKNLIEKSLRHHGPGTHTTTLTTHRAEIDELLTQLQTIQVIDLSSFWSAGQVRSHDYERELRKIFFDYNTSKLGFLQCRPDLVVEPFKPCEISSSSSDSDVDINDAIRRSAIACEFTAIKEFSLNAIQVYLGRKLTNYVEMLQEQ